MMANGHNQVGNGHANGHKNGHADAPAQIAAGGAGTSLDMASEKDRALIRTAMKRWPKRWRGLTDAHKDSFANGLVVANEAAVKMIADPTHDPDLRLKAISAAASCARTAVMMEGQNQADEHEEEKCRRLDSGSPTNIQENRVIVVKFDDRG